MDINSVATRQLITNFVQLKLISTDFLIGLKTDFYATTILRVHIQLKHLLIVYCEFFSSTAWRHKAARTRRVVYIPQSNLLICPSSEHNHILINGAHTQAAYCVLLLRLQAEVNK